MWKPREQEKKKIKRAEHEWCHCHIKNNSLSVIGNSFPSKIQTLGMGWLS